MNANRLVNIAAALAVFGIAESLATPANAGAVAITVTVGDIGAPQGSILAALHDAGGWSAPALDLASVPADAGEVTLSLSAPSPGRYGVRLFHDMDGDGELDANLVGIPTEPFGFSNDAPLNFGPPSFEDAAFDVGADGAVLTITLR